MAVLAESAERTIVAPRLGISPALLLVLLALTAARMVFAAIIPLTEDEAYYRLWAEHLAFGYFDHPPMTAWWIAAGRSLFGDTPLADRAVSILATLAVSLLIVDAGRCLGLSQKVSERAALWYNAALLIALGGAVITPDAPATFFWTLCLWSLARAFKTGSLGFWLGAGLAAGLGCLSKYSALFIGPGALLWLISNPKGRRLLSGPGPWTALVVAALVFSPNVVWNAQHHWLSFAKQFARVTPQGFTPGHVLDFPATQFLLLNPILAVFALRGVFTLPWRSPEAQALSLLPIGIAPFSLYLVLHSFHDGVQAHWPAPLYPALALIAAEAAERVHGLWWRRAAIALPVLGFGLSALAFAHMALPQTDVGRKDPALPLRGWSRFADAVEAARLRAGAGWTGTFSYGTAAELLNQARSPAPVLELIERARYAFEGPVPEPSGRGLVVELGRRITPGDLTDCFTEVTPVGEIDRGDPGGPKVGYSSFLVGGPKRPLAAQGCREGKDRFPRRRS